MELPKDKKGRYRCPFDCSDITYPFPPRKWKTEKGVRKHMTECPFAPPAEPWVKPTPELPPLFAACPVCGDPVFEGESIWHWAEEEWCCYLCVYSPESFDILPAGSWDCAGLKTPGMADFRA